MVSKHFKDQQLFVFLVRQTTEQLKNVLYFQCINLLIQIINLKGMKVFELEYKMKSSRHIKDITDLSKLKVAKKAVNVAQNNQNDDFLQSAQDFYIKNNFKREAQPVKYHNHQMNIKQDDKEDPAIHMQRSSKGGTSRITPDNLKRSVERDYTNNLQHWRKETFKYQEQVFALERKNSELITENNNLKYELKLRQEDRNIDSKKVLLSNPQLQLANSQKTQLEKKIKKLESQLQQKGKRLSQLEIVLKILSQKFQQNNSTIFDRIKLNDSSNSSPTIQSLSKDHSKIASPISPSQRELYNNNPKSQFLSKQASKTKNLSYVFSILKSQ